jgi:hypothetical protein
VVVVEVTDFFALIANLDGSLAGNLFIPVPTLNKPEIFQSLKFVNVPANNPVVIGSSPRTIDFIQGPKKKTARKHIVIFFEANEYNKAKKAFVVPAMEAGIINTLISVVKASAKKQVRKKCPHGRRKGSCRECGGAGFAIMGVKRVVVKSVGEAGCAIMGVKRVFLKIVGERVV